MRRLVSLFGSLYPVSFCGWQIAKHPSPRPRMERDTQRQQCQFRSSLSMESDHRARSSGPRPWPWQTHAQDTRAALACPSGASRNECQLLHEHAAGRLRVVPVHDNRKTKKKRTCLRAHQPYARVGVCDLAHLSSARSPRRTGRLDSGHGRVISQFFPLGRLVLNSMSQIEP